jgi:hypothetical protein
LYENLKDKQYFPDMYLLSIHFKYNNQVAKLYRTIQWQNINKYKHKYDIYDVIISSLNDYKTRKTQFINREFNKYIKYCDYAEEQCEIQEKLLLYIMQINTYVDELNNIVETILIEPIPKHICSISINTIIVLSQFETKIKKLKQNNNNIIILLK